MEIKNLLDISSLDIPNDGRLVYAPAEQKIPLLVPLERKDWSLMPGKLLLQLAWRC